MNTSVDTSTNAALRELTQRPPPGVSPHHIQQFLRHNYERVWTRVAQLVEPRRPRDWELTWIGCGQAKRGGEQRAVDLYTGSLFRAHLAIARHSTGRNPQILSAEHALSTASATSGRSGSPAMMKSRYRGRSRSPNRGSSWRVTASPVAAPITSSRGCLRIGRRRGSAWGASRCPCGRAQFMLSTS